MDRRMFLKSAVAGSLAVGIAGTSAATSYFPAQVDLSLFEGINRVKDHAKMTALEKSHSPVIKAPVSVKAGEMFTFEVAIGEIIHPMVLSHWIQFIDISIGNEPAGRMDFQPRGYMRPKAVFTLVIPREAAQTGKITLVARQLCNLHGLWEERYNISVS